MFGLTDKETRAILVGSKRMSSALRILRYIVSMPVGATCDDCTEALGLPHQMCSPRFSELEHSKCLVATGRTKKTQNGAPARVMRVADNANFRDFLAYTRSKRRAQPGAREASFAHACEAFVTKWRSNEGKEEAVRIFVLDVLKADKKYKQPV